MVCSFTPALSEDEGERFPPPCLFLGIGPAVSSSCWSVLAFVSLGSCTPYKRTWAVPWSWSGRYPLSPRLSSHSKDPSSDFLSFKILASFLCITPLSDLSWAVPFSCLSLYSFPTKDTISVAFAFYNKGFYCCTARPFWGSIRNSVTDCHVTWMS